MDRRLDIPPGPILNVTAKRTIVLTDSPLLGDYSPRPSMDAGDPTEEEEFSVKRMFTWRKLRVLLLSLGLISVMTAEVIIRKLNTVYMKNYITFMNVIVLLACVVAFFGMVYWHRRHHMDHLVVTKRLLWWFCGIAFLDTLGSALILCAAAYVSAPLATLLSQGVIPLTMVASIFFLRRRFHANHWVGASLIMLANIVSIVLLRWGSSPSNNENSNVNNDAGGVNVLSLAPNSLVLGTSPLLFMQQILNLASNSSSFSSSTSAALSSSPEVSDFLWSVLFFVSNFPVAASSIAKEAVLLSDMRLDMPTLNAWVALFQLAFSLVLSPVIYLLQRLHKHADLSDIPSNFAAGFKCWLAGQSTFAEDQCDHAVWSFWLHILIIIGLNVLVLRVIFHGSATLFFVASGVSIPLVLLVSALPFMGPARVEFFWYDILTVLGTLIGLILYRLQPEDVEMDVDDMDFDGALLATATDGSLSDVSSSVDEINVQTSSTSLLDNISDDSPNFGNQSMAGIINDEDVAADVVAAHGRFGAPDSPVIYSRRAEFWGDDEEEDGMGAHSSSASPGFRRFGRRPSSGVMRLPPPPMLNLNQSNYK